MGLSDLPEALAQLLSGNQLAVSARFVLVKLQRVGLLLAEVSGSRQVQVRLLQLSLTLSPSARTGAKVALIANSVALAP